MKVLLLNPPWPHPVLRDYYCSSVAKSDYLWPPVDLLAQAAWLRHYGITVRLLDAVAERLDPAEVLRVVRGYSPDALLILTSPLTEPDDMALLRHLGHLQVFATGEQTFAYPERWLEGHVEVRGVLTDFTSDALARYLKEGETGGHGLWVREGGRIIAGPTRASPTFEMPPLANDLLHLNLYSMPALPTKPFATILTDFGCPFRCRFCNSGVAGHKTRTLESIRQEILSVKRLGVHHAFVKDMSFGAQREHAFMVCDLLAEAGLTWNAYVRPEDLDDEMAQKMAESGCVLVQLGAESGDSRMRKAYGKGLNGDVVVQAVRRARQAGMRVGLHLTIGLPGEDLTSLFRSSQLLQETRPDYVSINIATLRLGSLAERRGVRWTGLSRNIRLLLLARFLMYLRLGLNPRWWLERLLAYSPHEVLHTLASAMRLSGNVVTRSRAELGWIRTLRKQANQHLYWEWKDETRRPCRP